MTMPKGKATKPFPYIISDILEKDKAFSPNLPPQKNRSLRAIRMIG
jgi:hypothetical protein